MLLNILYAMMKNVEGKKEVEETKSTCLVLAEVHFRRVWWRCTL